MATTVSVLGAGTWGTAFGAMLASRVRVNLWARRPSLVEVVASRHVNPDYLPEVRLPSALAATASLEEALRGADVVVLAVPSHGFRSILSQAAPHLPARVPLVSLTKGIERPSLCRMTEVIAEVAPGHPRGVLTGPNLAGEVVAGYPTASVVAVTDGGGPDPHLAGELQQLFSAATFRVYTNDDVVGCELGGSLKNVFAIAAGMSDGMGFGANARGALLTRGLAELTRLGAALGGEPLTFSGLTGMGDLVATCTSPRSRNRHVGEQLGRGRTIEEVTAEMRMVAEGIRTSAAVVELAARTGVEMPIAEQVTAVVHEGKPAREVLPALMLREMKPELHGIAAPR